ncbi:MAG: TetR/AcrR family transcriptional regulator [Hyphomonadaceae bacterium]
MAIIDLAEPSKRERAKAANRQAILEAARRVFADLGYDATTVRDIIRGTELASGTFYNYFKSKEEVFEALQDDSAYRFRPLLREQCERAETFEEFVRGALDAYFHFLAEEKAQGRIMQRPDSPFTHRVDTPEMKAIFEEVRMQIQTAIGRGLAPDLDPDYLAAASIGLAREVGERMLMRGGDDVAHASAFCAGLLLRGVGGAGQRG